MKQEERCPKCWGKPEIITSPMEYDGVVICCLDTDGFHARVKAPTLKEAVDLWLALPREKKEETK